MLWFVQNGFDIDCPEQCVKVDAAVPSKTFVQIDGDLVSDTETILSSQANLVR